MPKRLLLSACAAVGALVAGVAPAYADPVVVPFNVVVGSTQGDMTLIFGVPVDVGDVIHSTLTFDDDAVASSPAPGFESFAPISGSIALSLGSGLSLPLEAVDVFDVQPGGLPFDLDTVAAVASTTSVPGFDSIVVLLDFQGPPESRATTAVPRSAAEFASFAASGSFRLEGAQSGVNPPFDSSSHEILGRVDFSSRPTPAPEPGTLLLVLGGAGALMRPRNRG